MKLYNRSLIPDEALHPALVKAGRLVGARTRDVVVRVNGNWRNHVSHGVFWNRKFVDKNWLEGKRRDWTTHLYCTATAPPMVETDGGMIELWIGLRQGLINIQSFPTLYSTYSAAEKLVKQFFSTAIHEWKHIADYQNGEVFSGYGQVGAGSRRPNWDVRPEEIRACDTVHRVLAKGDGLQLFPEVLAPLVESIETILSERRDE